TGAADYEARGTRRPGLNPSTPRLRGPGRGSRCGPAVSSWIVDLGELPTAVGTFVAALMVSHGLVLSVAAPLTVLGLVLISLGLDWTHQRCWLSVARLVEILPPPQSDMAGDAALL